MIMDLLDTWEGLFLGTPRGGVEFRSVSYTGIHGPCIQVTPEIPRTPVRGYV